MDTDFSRTPASKGLAEHLTVKERRILLLLADGYSNNALAEKQSISESTVRTHLRNINAKLSAQNRTQAVSIARRLGLIQ
jgi:LuxR family maltose regulon positive regulatory protein